MFQVAVSESFWNTVRVEIINDHGHKKVQHFKAKFKRLEQDELDVLNERAAAGDVSDQQVIDDVLLGWADVKDLQGNDLEFNQDNLKALLAIHPTRRCIVKSFFDAVYPDNAARKN